MREREQQIFNKIRDAHPISRGRIVSDLDYTETEIQDSLDFLKEKGFIVEGPIGAYVVDPEYKDWY